MARPPRIHYSGAYYHAMLRGNNGQLIFFSDRDRHCFYLLLEEMRHRFQCRIHGFCLMSNHVHLAIQVGNVPLSKILHTLCSRYARWINLHQDRVGHLFQGRYRAILVESDGYLMQLIRYIHLNPIRAGLCQYLNDYPWSSHLAYLGLSKLPWLTKKQVLSYFSGNSKVARMNYYQFVLSEINQDDLGEEFIVGNHDGLPILGSDDFLKKVMADEADVENKVCSFQDVVNFVCSKYGIELSLLCGNSRIQEYAKVRAIVLWLSQELKLCSFAEVARYFKRDPSGLIRSKNRLMNNKKTMQELSLLKTEIMIQRCQA